MDQIRLGGSGLHVSRVCLGMMSYGNDSDRYTRRELADEREIIQRLVAFRARAAQGRDG